MHSIANAAAAASIISLPPSSLSVDGLYRWWTMGSANRTNDRYKRLGQRQRASCHRVSSAEFLSDSRIEESLFSNDFTFEKFRLLCASFPLPRIRSGRYIFVPNEPCPFFQICEIMRSALGDAKTHFPNRLRQQFRPDRTSEFPLFPLWLSLPSYPPHVASGRFFTAFRQRSSPSSPFLCLLPRCHSAD